jgi:hypothetical protein
MRLCQASGVRVVAQVGGVFGIWFLGRDLLEAIPVPDHQGLDLEKRLADEARHNGTLPAQPRRVIQREFTETERGGQRAHLPFKLLPQLVAKIQVSDLIDHEFLVIAQQELVERLGELDDHLVAAGVGLAGETIDDGDRAPVDGDVERLHLHDFLGRGVLRPQVRGDGEDQPQCEGDVMAEHGEQRCCEQGEQR